MRRIPMSFLRGMLCFMCLGLLLVACQNEGVKPASPTGNGRGLPFSVVLYHAGA